jgi:enoyl-[acyl-carrier protein] reductase I
MLDLKGKAALVTGIANKRSIAYAIAKDLAARGARLAISYLPLEKDSTTGKIEKLTEELRPELLVPLDVTSALSVNGAFKQIKGKFSNLHVLVHSIAGAKREELSGKFYDTSLDGYQLAHNVSAYSLIELVRAARPLMEKEGGSVITLSYIGSVRTVKNYNVMGSAKSALEANVRYLAADLGEEGIRVNAISAGPIRTVSSSGIRDFLDLLHLAKENSALKRNVTPQEVAHTVSFLASSLSSGITGQVIYVDGGYNNFG